MLHFGHTPGMCQSVPDASLLHASYVRVPFFFVQDHRLVDAAEKDLTAGAANDTVERGRGRRSCGVHGKT